MGLRTIPLLRIELSMLLGLAMQPILTDDELSLENSLDDVPTEGVGVPIDIGLKNCSLGVEDSGVLGSNWGCCGLDVGGVSDEKEQQLSSIVTLEVQHLRCLLLDRGGSLPLSMILLILLQSII